MRSKGGTGCARIVRIAVNSKFTGGENLMQVEDTIQAGFKCCGALADSRMIQAH